jgi:hypothetical protein
VPLVAVDELLLLGGLDRGAHGADRIASRPAGMDPLDDRAQDLSIQPSSSA